MTISTEEAGEEANCIAASTGPRRIASMHDGEDHPATESKQDLTGDTHAAVIY